MSATLLASQTASFVIISRERLASSEIVDLYRLNERAFSLVKIMAPLDVPERKRVSGELTDSTMVVNLSAVPAVTADIASTDKLAELEDILVGRLSRFGIVDARVRLNEPQGNNNKADPASLSEAGDVEADLSIVAADFLKSGRYTVSLLFNEGQWLNFATPVTPIGPILSTQSLPLYLLLSALVVTAVFWAIRKLTMPYQVLERAVTRLGSDLNSTPLNESGSMDYRSATRALNQMQARLLAYVEERELVAAALAHDLRTPITRMRLRLSLMKKSSIQAALSKDISHIEATVQSVIDLARLDLATELPEELDFWSMVDSVVDEYDFAVIENEKDKLPRLLCRAPPQTLNRCFRNLIDNAIKYGKKAHLTITFTDDKICLSVHDEGHGISQAKLDMVFQPFVRIDNDGRNGNGGAGLGLTITRNMIRKAGGEISLSNHPDGGLIAQLSIPRLKVPSPRPSE